MSPPTSEEEIPSWHTSGQKEVGVGVGVSENLGQLGYLGYLDPVVGLSGDFWYLRNSKKNPQLQLGLTVFGGNVALVGGGGILRYYFVNKENTHIGFGFQAGWAWAGIEFPMGFRLRNHLWFYTAPALKVSLLDVLHIPLGISYETPNDQVLTTAINLSSLGYYGDPQPAITLEFSYGKRF